MEVDQAATAEAEASSPEGPQLPQQQQEQQATVEAAAAAASEPATSAAAAAGEEPLEGFVGMLGLGAAQDELQQWLREEAAAADVRQRQRTAAAAGDSGGESTDAGFSEGESEWGLTSGGETTGDEGADVDEYNEYNEDV